MELRLLSGEAERRLFEQGMIDARSHRGGAGRRDRCGQFGYREKARSRAARVHLEHGRLYGVVDDEGPEPNRLIGGFVMHSLEEFSQSYPRPDLTHLPPESVFEVGELWAMVPGGGLAARHGIVALLDIFHAQAMLAYAIVKPWNLAAIYRECRPVADPIPWPYVETVTGGPIIVQAMLLDGPALEASVRRSREAGFKSVDGDRVIKLYGDHGCVRGVSKRLRAAAQAAANGTTHNLAIEESWLDRTRSTRSISSIPANWTDCVPEPGLVAASRNGVRKLPPELESLWEQPPVTASRLLR
jgi:hypothetical protein